MINCDLCGASSTDAAKFCGNCGRRLTRESTSMAITSPGVVLFAEPDVGSALAGELSIGESVSTASTQSTFTAVGHEGTLSGFALNSALAGNASSSITLTHVDSVASATERPGSRGVDATMIVAVLAGVGIIIGAAIDWTQGAAATGFDLPAGFLFDWKSTDADPKVGYFLVAIGIIAILVILTRGPALLVAGCGLVALIAAGLFFIQTNSLLDAAHSDTSVTDVIGAGPWIVGISGLVLLISPTFASASSSA